MADPDVRDWTLPAIEAAVARISTLAHNGDLTTPAVGLGRWRARDIVAHLGGVHRWAARIVATGSMEGPGHTASKLTGDGLCDWFDEGAASLVAILRDTDPDRRCANFSPGSRALARFWHRRQAHESTVHRWDLERCFAAETPIEPTVADDGAEEYLCVFLRSRGKQTLLAPLTITALESDRAWTVRPGERAGRVDIAPGRAPDAAAGITGPAAAVLLHLWGRTPLDALTVTGDREVAVSFRQAAPARATR